MEQNPDIRSVGRTDTENDNALEKNVEIGDIMAAAYKHADLMSLLSENLMFCSNVGAALYAVATNNEKALLKLIACKRQ